MDEFQRKSKNQAKVESIQDMKVLLTICTTYDLHYCPWRVRYNAMISLIVRYAI